MTNILQHHLPSDYSRERIYRCLINQLREWNHFKREEFYSRWAKNHTNTNTEWLKAAVANYRNDNG